MTFIQRINKLLIFFGLYEGDRKGLHALFTVRLLFIAGFFCAQNIWLIYYYNPVISTIAIVCMALGSGVFVLLEFYRYFKERPTARFAWVPLLLWLAFAITATVAELSHGILLNSLVYLLVIPGVVLIIGTDRNNYSLILSGAILGHLPMLLIGFLEYPLVNNSYSLVLACAAALFFVPLWNIFRASKLNWGRLLYCSINLLFCIVLSWNSGGRTGFLTITALFILFFGLVALRYRGLPPCLKPYRIFHWITVLLIVLIVLVTGALGGFVYKYFTESREFIVKPSIIPPIKYNTFTYTDTDILEKMSYVIQKSDPLSGRQIVWEKVLQHPTWLGNPPDFFQSIGLPSYMQTAHNSFLAVFAQLGIPALIFYLIAYIAIFYLAIRYYCRNKESSLCIFPLLIVFSYTAAGLFEDLSYIVSSRVHALLFYVVAAYLIVDAASWCKRTGQFRLKRQSE